MAFVTFSDAGGVGAFDGLADDRGLPEDPTQGAWTVCATDKSIIENRSVRASVLGWRSSKLRRKVPSTLAGETQALAATVSEVEYLQILYRDIIVRDVDISDHHRGASPFTT
eukprot:6809993-Pyramimonas_sp.AAC.1